MLDKIAHIALEPAAEPARKRSVSEDYAVAADLPRIYQSATSEEAEIRLGEFEDKWDAEYLPIGQS